MDKRDMSIPAMLARFDRDPSPEHAIDLTRALRMVVDPRDVGVAQARDLNDMGHSIRAIAESTEHVGLWREVVQFMRLVLACTPEGHLDAARYRYALVRDLLSLTALDGGSADRARETVEHAQAVASAVPLPSDVRLSSVLLLLSTAYNHWYAATGDLDLLRTAVDAGRNAVRALRPGEDEPGARSALGVALRQLAEAEGDDSALLAEAIAQNRAAALAADSSNPNRPRLWSNLASCLTEYAHDTADRAAMDEAVAAATRAVECAPSDHPRLFLYLGALGSALSVRAEYDNDERGHQLAIETLRQAVAITPSQSPFRSAVLQVLGQVEYRARSASRTPRTTAASGAAKKTTAEQNRARQLIRSAEAALTQFGLDGKTERLQDAIAAWRAALPAFPADGGTDETMARISVLIQLMNALQIYSRRSEEQALLRESLAHGQEALALLDRTPHIDPSVRQILMSRIGTGMATLGAAENDRDAIRAGIELAVAAARNPPSASTARVLLVSGTNLLRKIATSVDDDQYLMDAIALAQTAQPRLPGDAAHFQADAAASLAVLAKRTSRAEDIAGLAAAAGTAADLAASIPGTDALLAGELSSLMITVSELITPAETHGLLTVAIRLGRTAIAHTPPMDPDYQTQLSNVLNLITHATDSQVDDELVTEAVILARAAVAAAEPGDSRQVRNLDEMASCLRRLYSITNDPILLNEAVAAHRSGLRSAPDDLGHLSGLSMTLTTKAINVGGETADEAVDLAHAALAAAEQDDPARHSLHNALGIALVARVRISGDLPSLHEAIDQFRLALAVADPDSDSHTGYTFNLCQSLTQAHQREGDFELLAEAVPLGRHVATVTPAGHPEYTKRLDAHAAALIELFHRTSDTALLAEAADTLRSTLAATDESSPEYAARLNNVATVFQAGYKPDPDLDTYDAITALLRQVVECTPAAHPLRASRTAALAAHLVRGVEDESDDPPEVPAEAILLARESVERTADDSPKLARHLNVLGRLAALAAVRSPDSAHFGGEAIAALQRAASAEGSSPVDRLSAHLTLLSIGIESSAALDSALALIRQFADRTLSQQDRTFRLAQSDRSAVELLTGAALRLSGVIRAVEVLEQTRGILVADRLQLRSTDLIRLDETFPELSLRFQRAAAILDQLDSQAPDAISDVEIPLPARRTAELRRRALAEQADVIADIRAHENFGDFLQPSFHRLAEHTGDRPVVYVMLGQPHGTAIIVDIGRNPPARVVPLPELTDETATENIERLQQATHDAGDPDLAPTARIEAQQRIHTVLRWIWDAIAGDVLDALGYIEPSPTARERRVWWCPVGLLGHLPLHAAGYHSDTTDSGPRTVLDRVVSSYTPTLQSLAFARTRRTEPQRATSSLVVAVADAPGMPLPGAHAEAAAVAALLPDARILHEPTRDTLIDDLAGHHTAHFACHGVANPADAATSHLVLIDYEHHPLTVAYLNKQRLDTELAYLSACETSISSHELVDEAVHLSGALHLAGYRQVIGTLWPIGEFASQRMAVDFYHGIARDGTLDVTDAAFALHTATVGFRDEFPNTPSAWAAYLHIGP
ncbi:CHAT domain-containing protein [Nocardia sp. NPDC051756]|uniref:CHAT domain-containing protein n=1 Tax=Nocardia sp. NPDC051756 TaxID=3154751 RepID=UPI003415FB1E